MSKFKTCGFLAFLTVLVLVASGVVYVKWTSKPVPTAPVGITVAEQGGAPNPAEDQAPCSPGPVNCATGEFWKEFSDFSIPGPGIPLDLTQTYLSAAASRPSPFGYGWTDSYAMSLTPPHAAGRVTIRQEDGAVVSFVKTAKHGFTAPARVMATLTRNRAGQFIFVRDSDQVRYVFSRTGRLISERDLNGDATTLSYRHGELAEVTDAVGRELDFSYQNGHVTSITGPMGATESLFYSRAGDLTEMTDPAGRSWQFGYGRGHQLTSITDPRGIVTKIKYRKHKVVALVGPGDAHIAWAYHGQPSGPSGGTTIATGPGPSVTAYHYVGLSLMSVTNGTGPAAATTSYGYDKQSLVTSVTDPDGHVTLYRYDRAGFLLSSTDPLGRTTRYRYNKFGEVTAQILPSGATSHSWYDGHGNLVKSQDAVGNVTTYTLDQTDPGLISKVYSPGAEVTTFTYDAYGNVASTTTSPSVGVTDTSRYAYDADGNLTCEVSPDAVVRHIKCPAPPVSCPVYGGHVLGTSSYALNCDGDVVASTDPAGDVTRYSYDPDGDLAATTSPTGTVTSYSYNPAGQTTQVAVNAKVTTTTSYDAAGDISTQSNAAGDVTRYQYDSLGHLVAMTDPLGKQTTYHYDPAGNLLRTVAAGGQQTYYTYDASGELTAIAYSASAVPAIGYAYTPDGQQSEITDSAGTTSYTYDGDERLLTATSTTSAGLTTKYSYAYDAAMNNVTLTYPNGRTVTDHYDDAGQLSKVTDWLGNTTQFSYDASGNLTYQHVPGGVDANYGPTSITIKNAEHTLAIFGYTRNQTGLISDSASFGVPDSSSQVVKYGYTARGQLATESGLTFGYDAAGNLTSSSSGGGFDQTYNPAGELSTRTSSQATISYAYDDNGNLTSAAPTSGQPTTLSYNQANLLASYNAPGNSASYSYDGTGLLASETHAGNLTNFVWDQGQATPFLLATSSSPTADPSTPSPSPSASPSAPASAPGYTSYIYGPNGQPIEQVTGNRPTFLISDQQGSVRLITNLVGHVIEKISYGPYGTVAGRSGSDSSALGYDGQYTDPATGFVYLRARYYNPQTAQFLTRDPDIVLSGAPYSYAGDDPVNASDLTGLSWWNPFSWSVKTWVNIGLAAALGVGAVFTDGADLALAPEAFGLDAATEALGDGLLDAGTDVSEDLFSSDAESAAQLNYTAPGDPAGSLAPNIKPIDGYQDVVVHGSPTDFSPSSTAGAPVWSPEDLADMIKSDSRYGNGPIRLISCSTGAPGSDAAQNLANELGVDVLAPTDIVWVDGNGALTVAPRNWLGIGPSRFSSAIPWKLFSPIPGA